MTATYNSNTASVKKLVGFMKTICKIVLLLSFLHGYRVKKTMIRLSMIQTF